jgi:hypothetical protein
LVADAGEIAYAIVLILAGRLFFAGLFILRSCATASLGRKALRRASIRCCSAPDRIAGWYEIRAEMKLVPGTLGYFLETHTRVAQKGVALINLSHKFFSVYISCTMDGETRRLGYQSFNTKHVVCVISVTI